MSKNPPITTVRGLLEALYSDPLFGDHRKTGARVRCFQPGQPEIIEYYDDGRGHSGAFTSATTPLDREVFQEALHAGFISGVLEPGYVSTIEFEMTDQGKQELFRLWREAKAAEKAAVQA